MDWIRIHGFELDCIVGIWPHERVREQRVGLELSLGVDTRHAARSGRVAHTVRYDIVANQLAAMLHFRKYQLLEVAADELAAMLLAIHPSVNTVRLRIKKPKALEGKALAASVEVQRTREDFPQTSMALGSNSVNCWLSTRAISLSVHQVPEAEHVVSPANCGRALLIDINGVFSDGTQRMETGDSWVVEHADCGAWRASAGVAQLFLCAEPVDTIDD
jgi:dihydroneopterin aldolase